MKFKAQITMTLIYEADTDDYEGVVTPEDAIAFDLRKLREYDIGICDLDEIWDLELTKDPVQYDIKRIK